VVVGVRHVCVYNVCCVVCGVCCDVADVGGVWGSGNGLRAEGAAAVAGALSKLVNLTSLDLRCKWECGVCAVVCVCRVLRVWGVVLVVVISAVCACCVVSCVVLSWYLGMWLMLMYVGIRQYDGCQRSSGSGGCADQAGEPDELGLAEYVGMWSGWCRVCGMCGVVLVVVVTAVFVCRVVSCVVSLMVHGCG